MAKEWLTDAQVEEEIERLQESPFVKLARRETRVRYKRRQFLYGLRALEKRGKELTRAVITIEMLYNIEQSYEEEDE